MTELTERIKQFLNREPPKEVAYIPGSLVEMMLATYAEEGSLDDGAVQMLEICQLELDATVAEKSGPAKQYFADCADLVQEVLQANG